MLRRNISTGTLGFFVVLIGSTAIAQDLPADRAAADIEKPDAEKAATTARSEAKPVGTQTVAKPETTVSCRCPTSTLPVYVEDWGRLADLTQHDPAVFEKANFWRNRHESSRWLLVGAILGGGVATLATIDRLGTGDWTDTDKWGLAGGIALTAVSALAYLAFSPDRDDRLTVINHWNLRHPDRPLAP